MTEFLNPELKLYNALTREEKHILLDAAIDKNLQFLSGGSDWYDCGSEAFYDTLKYRTKPKEYKKLNVPWQVIDEKWKWSAMDDDISIYFFEKEPEWNNEDGVWSDNRTDYGDYAKSGIMKLDTTGIVAEHSLTERPE